MAKHTITFVGFIKGAFSKIKQLFSPPIFPDDEDKTRTARVLYALLLNMLIILVLALFATLFVFVKKTGSGILVLMLFCLILICFILARRGHIKRAGFIYVSGIWLVLALLIIFTGSINTVNNALLIAAIVIASILLGRRYAIFFAILSALLCLGLALLENIGYPLMRYFVQPPLASWVDLVIALLLTMTPLFLTLKGSEQSLARARKSEKRYATLFNEAPMMYLTIRNEGGRLVVSDCNAAFYNKLGYTQEEVVGQPLFRFYAPESQAALLLGDGFNRAIHGDINTPIERVLVTKDGRTINALVRATPDIDETGQVVGVLAMGLDVTEYKRIEAALLDSESCYRAFFEQGPDGVVILEPGTGKIIEFNDQACRQLGYSREEFALLLVADIDVMETPEQIKQHIHKTMINGREDFETRHRTKQEEIRNVHVTAQVINTSRRSIYHCIWRDITERKQAVAALMESELKYRTLFKSMGQGFYLSQILYDENGLPCDYRYIDVNTSFEKLIGLKRDEIIGKTYNELVPPDPESGWLDCFKRVAISGNPENFTFSSHIYNRFFEVYAFKSEQDKFSALVKDITESKQAEEKIRTALAEKETLLRELYHRTKNNMSVIISLLALQADFVNDPRLSEAFKDAQNRIRSMALVHQKLYETKDLSRINLKDYFQDLLNLLIKSYKVSPEKVTVVTEMDNVHVLIDTAIPCGLILNELICNSLKHAFPGGREGEIKVQLCRTENEQILLEVADNGIGAPADFDFRSKGRLGLQSVYSLGETQLRGKIEFKINPGVSFKLLFVDNLYAPRV
ncbi:MAG TPA: PAS domain S-box protein [bacterium]|nr:PAS domain S-box protein [bacterium]HPN45891.1 PAS domain S-box protein [bacterium]